MASGSVHLQAARWGPLSEEMQERAREVALELMQHTSTKARARGARLAVEMGSLAHRCANDAARLDLDERKLALAREEFETKRAALAALEELEARIDALHGGRAESPALPNRTGG
jgi:hypothetical protein